MGIVDNGIVKFNNISERIESKIKELEELSANVRKTLIDNGHIIEFGSIDDGDDVKNIITVDGAKILEQLSHTDLLVTGASIGEAGYMPPIYTDDNAPSTSYVDLLQHHSKNDSVSGALMALQELALIGVILKDNPKAIAVIDGSWTSSLTSVVIGLTKNQKVVKTTVDAFYNFLSENPELLEPVKISIHAILNPSDDNAKRIVALSKSDSKAIWVDRLKDFSPELSSQMDNFNIKDRALASTILLPGECLSSTYMDAGNSLASEDLNNSGKVKFQRKHTDKNIKDLLNWIIAETRASAHNLNQESGAFLWSSYFKPSVFENTSRSLRVEFIRSSSIASIDRPQNDAISITNDVIPHIRLINLDMNNDQILEPWCQFIADRRAKEVSALATIIRSQLAAGEHAAFFLNNYRT